MLRESIVPSVRLSVQVIHSGVPFMHSKMATTNTSRTVKSKNSRSFSEHLKRKWKPWEHIRCTCAPNRFHPLSTTTSFILERTRSEYAYECVCMCVCVFRSQSGCCSKSVLDFEGLSSYGAAACLRIKTDQL